MIWVKPERRQLRKTVLIVCEGKRDKAFLEYLRSVYTSGDPKSPRVDVKQSRGKGGNCVVDTLLGTFKVKSYDAGVAFLDGDAPPAPARLKELKKRRKGFQGHTITTRPCLEGLMLSILGERAPHSSNDCKERIEQLIGLRLYSHTEYIDPFPRAMIDAYAATCTQEDELRSLIDILRSRA